MSKEELIAFLKENLKIEVWCSYNYGLYDYTPYGLYDCAPEVNVRLSLCGEEIQTSSNTLLSSN